MTNLQATVNDRLSSCINDGQGSIHVDNGYSNKDNGLLGNYLLKTTLILLVMTHWLYQGGFQ